MTKRFKCLLCGETFKEHNIGMHKMTWHHSVKHYGMMWPLFTMQTKQRLLREVPVHESEIIAERLRVSKVYIRDEGQNFSGSMKDYMVEMIVKIGAEQNYNFFSVVSSGNHASSLAWYTKIYGKKAIVFVPASSSKIPFLSSLPNVFVVGVKNAIFEEVYKLANKVHLNIVYNANVNNEFSLTGFMPVAKGIAALDPIPNYVLAGAGNGSYTTGIVWGCERLGISIPKIIPVGMQGAFPIEEAFHEKVSILEYGGFRCAEENIDGAEGSIAIESYAMPQLMYALQLSEGFPLGSLTNDDLRIAYELLLQDEYLIVQGVIPEPTGIMGLAAAIKHRAVFKKSDVLLISFTGHGAKDQKGIGRLAFSSSQLIEAARQSRPDLLVAQNDPNGSILSVNKEITSEELTFLVSEFIKGGI